MGKKVVGIVLVFLLFPPAARGYEIPGAKTGPVILMACPQLHSAEAVVRAYAAGAKAGLTVRQFTQSLGEGVEDCSFINISIDELTLASQQRIRVNSRAVWSGPSLAEDHLGWPYTAWHIEPLTIRQGTRGEETRHLIILKRIPLFTSP